MTKGYAYAVSRLRKDGKIDWTRVKIGFFTSMKIEQEIHNNYSRTLTPLCIVETIPVGDARKAEAVMHYSLAKKRLNRKHEIFDLSTRGAEADFRKACETVRMIDKMSGLTGPDDRMIDYEKWKIHREAAKEGKTRMKRAETEKRMGEEKEKRQRHRGYQYKTVRSSDGDSVVIDEATRPRLAERAKPDTSIDDAGGADDAACFEWRGERSTCGHAGGGGCAGGIRTARIEHLVVAERRSPP